MLTPDHDVYEASLSTPPVIASVALTEHFYSQGLDLLTESQGIVSARLSRWPLLRRAVAEAKTQVGTDVPNPVPVPLALSDDRVGVKWVCLMPHGVGDDVPPIGHSRLIAGSWLREAWGRHFVSGLTVGRWTCRLPMRPLAWCTWTTRFSSLRPLAWEKRNAPELLRCSATSAFPLHGIQCDERVLEAIGLELHGLEMAARPATRKRERLCQAWVALRRRSVLSGQGLEQILGHLTHVMLLSRPGLAVFSAVYTCIRRHYRVRRTLWKSVYAELRAAFALVPLLSVDWRLPWRPVTTCSDASGYGYAVREARFPLAEIRGAGCWSDRWRFALGAGNDPRLRALGAVERPSDEAGQEPVVRWKSVHP